MYKQFLNISYGKYIYTKFRKCLTKQNYNYICLLFGKINIYFLSYTCMRIFMRSNISTYKIYKMNKHSVCSTIPAVVLFYC